MPLAGTLQQFALADVLQVIENGQRTGVLVVTHADLQANIYFTSGQWAAAERVGATQVLAQQLVRAGLITPEDFEAVFGVTFVQAGAIADAQVVRALIGARVVTPDQLRAFAMQDAASLLSVILSWSDGEFAFEDGVALPQGRVALPLPVGSLIEQAYQLAFEQARPQPVMPAARQLPVQQVSPDAVLDFTDIDPKSGSAVEVTRDQWKMLTVVDGQTPLWALAENLGAPVHIIQRLAGELVAAKVVVVLGNVGAAAYAY
jgi:Domain of unknown function (DUF4388)